jgi:hypothetical protein
MPYAVCFLWFVDARVCRQVCNHNLQVPANSPDAQGHHLSDPGLAV